MLEFSPIEEIDILIEMQNPFFIYSTDSLDEQIAFAKYINNLSNRRILLLGEILFDAPFTISGLRENHIETLLKEGGTRLKQSLFSAFNNPNFLAEVQKFADELDRRGKTTENSARLKNILQYLKDNRFII